MPIDATLLRGRARMESLMVDACTVERAAGETVGAGGVVTPSLSTIYSGKCRITVRTRERLGGSWMNVGEAALVVSRLELQLPITAAELHEADLITMTDSRHDPQLIGRTFRVRDVMTKTHLTSRRATVIEVSS